MTGPRTGAVLSTTVTVSVVAAVLRAASVAVQVTVDAPTTNVDPDTGAPTVERIVWADDAGLVINPMLVRGQLVGGAAQGLGQALMERMVYDDTGQPITGSLMDYAIPRASDMPPIEIESMHIPSPHNLLGAKGVGEAGCIGVPAALMNAARDALQPFGDPELQFPLTAEQFWRAMTSPHESPNHEIQEDRSQGIRP